MFEYHIELVFTFRCGVSGFKPEKVQRVSLNEYHFKIPSQRNTISLIKLRDLTLNKITSYILFVTSYLCKNNLAGKSF